MSSSLTRINGFGLKVVKQPFLSAKEVLSSDPSKPLALSVDAGLHGIGAVLSHILEDGSQKSIEYACRTLSMAEINYAEKRKG